MTVLALESTVESLLVSSKGILAADESVSTIEKRFKAVNISSTEENRGTYREMLFTTPGLSELISGVILLRHHVKEVAKQLKAALQADYVVLNRGNVRLLKKLSPCSKNEIRLGMRWYDSSNAPVLQRFNS